MATENELQRIAGAVNKLRPDWSAKSVLTILRDRYADRAYADLALALTAVALDPTSQTPARVAEPGPWWKLTQQAAQGLTPGVPHADCPEHPEYLAARCPRCEAAAAEPTPEFRQARLTLAEAVRAARAASARAQARRAAAVQREADAAREAS